MAQGLSYSKYGSLIFIYIEEKSAALLIAKKKVLRSTQNARRTLNKRPAFSMSVSSQIIIFLHHIHIFYAADNFSGCINYSSFRQASRAWATSAHCSRFSTHFCRRNAFASPYTGTARLINFTQSSSQVRGFSGSPLG